MEPFHILLKPKTPDKLGELPADGISVVFTEATFSGQQIQVQSSKQRFNIRQSILRPNLSEWSVVWFRSNDLTEEIVIQPSGGQCGLCEPCGDNETSRHTP